MDISQLKFEPVKIVSDTGSHYVVRSYLPPEASQQDANELCAALHMKHAEVTRAADHIYFQIVPSESENRLTLQSMRNFTAQDEARKNASTWQRLVGLGRFGQETSIG